MIGSRRCGYVEGRNLSFVLRFSPGDPAAVDATLPELMQIPADLMVSYGASQRKTCFRLAANANLVLRGEKPADPPIEQPTYADRSGQNLVGPPVPGISCRTKDREADRRLSASRRGAAGDCRICDA